MKHTKFISAITLGSLSAVVIAALAGCSQEEEVPANRILVIEQLSSGKYVVVEETPTNGSSRAIIREKDENGVVHERIMTEAEMKSLAEQEYQKVQNGTSETTQSGGGEGMGLAGTILAVAAGSLLGNMIANQLMGNKNFSRNSNRSNKSAFHKKSKSSGSKKKSFFNKSKSGSSSKRSSSFGG